MKACTSPGRDAPVGDHDPATTATGHVVEVCDEVHDRLDRPRDELGLEAGLVTVARSPVEELDDLLLAAKTFTTLWPVKTSSMWPSRSPIRSTVPRNCFCERRAMNSVADHRERPDEDGDEGQDPTDREHHDEHADDGESRRDELP